MLEFNPLLKIFQLPLFEQHEFIGGIKFMKDMSDFPEVVRLESSCVCNFNCVHCANGQEHPNRKDGGILDKKLFSILLKQFNEHKYMPRVMVLYHGGEPLLNKDLSYFIREARAVGISRVKIVTNCSLLTAEKSEELIRSGLTDIDMSFDGFSAEENDYLRKNGNFKRDSQHAIDFIRIALREAADIRIRIGNVQILTKEELDDGRIKRDTPQYLKERFREFSDSIEFESYAALMWPDLEKSVFYEVDRIE